MKRVFLSASALALSAGLAQAGGLDRSGQSVSAIFAGDNNASLSFGLVTPSVTGSDDAGNDYDVGDQYIQLGMSYTNSVNDKFSYSVIFDQPYGANVSYNNDPTTSALGGTGADLSSDAITFIGKYQVTDRVSVFAGIGAQRVRADVQLNGQAYNQAISTGAVTSGFNDLISGTPLPALDSADLGAALALANAGDLSGAAAIDGTYGAGTFSTLAGNFSTATAGFDATGGYDFEMDRSTRPNYLIGAAYEIPDIALRFAATYRFETEHTADTVENLYGTVTRSEVEYVTPQSLNLEFQTGVAENTLLTASYRWTEFSAVDVVPTALGSDLVNLDDSERYTVGLGRAFSNELAGSLNLIYEPKGDTDLVSPLGPTDGQFGISVGGRYSKDNVNISGGINYTWLGDARAEVADQPQVSFEDNHAIGVGFKIDVTF